MDYKPYGGEGYIRSCCLLQFIQKTMLCIYIFRIYRCWHIQRLVRPKFGLLLENIMFSKKKRILLCNDHFKHLSSQEFCVQMRVMKTPKEGFPLPQTTTHEPDGTVVLVPEDYCWKTHARSQSSHRARSSNATKLVERLQKEDNQRNKNRSKTRPLTLPWPLPWSYLTLSFDMTHV